MKTRTRFAVVGLAVALLAVGAVLAQEAGAGRQEMQKARAAMADRDYAGAAGVLEELIRTVGSGNRVEEAEVLLLRARIGLGQYEQAISAGQAFLGKFAGSPFEPKIRSLMADAWVKMKDFRDAARIYRERTDFLSGDTHLGKVAGYYLELAKKAFEGENQPDQFGRPHLVRDYARALAYYRKARDIHLAPKEAPVVAHRIATSLAEIGKKGEAVAEWKGLLEKWPQSDVAAEATYRIGETLLALNDRLGARKYLHQVIDDHTDTDWAPLARIALGRSYAPLTTRDENDLDRGLGEWREFLRLYPSNEESGEVSWLIGDAEFRFGRFDAAIEDLGKYLASFGAGEHAPEAQNDIALAFYRKADFERAIAEWKKFLGRWPNHELFTKVQGSITAAAFMKGRHPLDLWEKAPAAQKAALLDRAEKGFTAFLAEYPVDARASQAQYLLGEIDHRRSDFVGAVDAWQVVATKYTGSPEAPSALFRIGSTYEQDLKDLPKAIETYEELVKRYPRSREAGSANRLLAQFRKKLLEVVTERAQRTDETPWVRLRTRNIETLKVRAWRLNLEDRFRQKLSLAELEKVAVEILPPVMSKDVKTEDYEKYRLFERKLELDGLTGPGAWIVTIQDEDLTATTLVISSDLTIVTKSAPDQTLVFAVNERTGEPWPGVRVLLGAGGKVFAEGRTNEQGVYVRSGREGAGGVRYFAESGGNVAFTELPAAGGSTFGYSTKAYIYTDRPLYRPGHEVKVKGIYRRADGATYSPSAGEPLDLEVRDPRDTVIHTGTVTTNGYGTFLADVWLPDTAALGSYRILVTNRQHQTFSGGFEVQEFRKPEFTITARADRRAYLPGESVKLDVALRYFFGGPVPMTTVRYTIHRGPFAFDPSVHDEFSWFTRDPAREQERERVRAAGMQPVSEGEIRTDADGNASLTFKAEDLDEDARYVVSFEALDLNREWVRESVPVVVTRQGYFALAKTEKKVYRPGEEISVDLTTVDALQFPVSRKGELVVARRAFVGDRETESEIRREAAETGEDGRVTVKVKVDHPGEVRLKFVGKDRAGNAVTGSTLVTIAGEAEDLGRQAKVVASRQIYREGEVAEVLVNSPAAPAWALLTFEGERVLDHQVVHLTEHSTTLRLLMKPDYAPNVFVRIAIPKDHELYEAGDEVYVFKYLQVHVAADRPEAKPGEKVDFTISTTDQRGQPVSAEVSLAVIDQSILALAPDSTPELKPFFYDQRRTHLVKTGSSYSFRYAGDTHPTNKAVLWEELRRQGREAFNRTMKYLQSGKELLGRGDLENAAIEFRKALQVSPMNYEARELLAQVTSRVETQRLREELSRKMDKLKSATKEAEEQGGWSGGGRAARRPGNSPVPDAPGGAVPKPRGGGFEPAEDGAPAAEKKNSDAYDARRDRKNDEGAVRRYVLKNAVADSVESLDVESLVPARLRQNFADTASWQPRVVTGADGKATVGVELPDNLTTWLAVARGVTKETLVGEARGSVVARKNLLVRLDAPRFLTQTDQATVTGTVHNNLGEEVDVHVDLAGANVTLSGSNPVAARLAPREIRPFDFGLSATEPGLVELTATAKTKVESDAARLGVPVVPHGLSTQVGRSGEVTEEAVENITLPGDVVPGTVKLHLTLSPGIDGTILESLVYLGGFPYGCLEQTVNRFLPAIAARQALDAIGSPDAKLKAALDRAVERGLLALYSFQNDDGSFGWFGGEIVRRMEDRKVRPQKGDGLMTAYAIFGMERARRAGFRVSESNRQRALAAGRRLVKETLTHSEKAFLLDALALAGAADLEDLNQLYRYRDGLGPFSLSTLALAMKQTNRSYNAVALVDLLKTRAVKEGALVHWEGDAGYGGPNAVEATSGAIRALLEVEPTSDLVPAAVKWLLLARKGPRWTSTRDTGAAVLALSAWLVREGVEKSDYVVEVWLNDGDAPYEKIPVAGGRVAGDNVRTVVVDAARLKSGKNRIRLVKKGPGRLFYTLLLRYVTAADKIEADGNLVRVDRRYTEYVSPVAAKEGKKEIKPGYTIVRPEARPKEDTSVTIERAGSGDKFRVRLTLDAREKLSYLILEDPLPAGVEVVEGQATGPFDWEERRDTKQVFFLSDVPPGKTEITYLVQAVHPGSYSALPAMAWPMYEPEIFGHSGENRLAVVPESGVVGKPATPEGVTPDEIYQVAVRDFADGKFEKVRDALTGLLSDFRLLDEYQTECQAMLMRANFSLGDGRKAVEAYERLVELNPRRGPKNREERRQLAIAYQQIGEFERALSLFKGVVDEHFDLEEQVAATYRSIGQNLEAQAFTEALVRTYPDSNAVIEASWKNALRYLEMKRPEGEKAPKIPGAIDAGLMLPEALDAFRAFLSHYPESPLADEADRMVVSVLSRMELFDDAVEEAQRFIRRYRDSIHLDDVYYYLTESYYSKGEFEKVFATGKTILDTKFRKVAGSRKTVTSPFVPHVEYLFAKVYHHRGDLAAAVKLYRKVASRFEDARDALDFLTGRALEIPDAVTFGVGEKVELPVRRKNLTGLELRIYPVDLMLLVAVKKDLRNANDVDLTGIAPKFTIRRDYPDGEDYRWHEEKVPVTGEGGALDKGVYLVVARSGGEATSSLVVVSDLDISVQVVGNKVRVYAVDRKSREPMSDVFVKISDGREIRAQGFTDARGIFEGQGVSGTLMVVAEKDGHCALVRR